jgi:hypothetical protein
MTLNIAKEVAAVGRMTVKDLRSKHIEVFGERTRSGHKDYLVKRIAWRMQATRRWSGVRLETCTMPACASTKPIAPCSSSAADRRG